MNTPPLSPYPKAYPHTSPFSGFSTYPQLPTTASLNRYSMYNSTFHPIDHGHLPYSQAVSLVKSGQAKAVTFRPSGNTPNGLYWDMDVTLQSGSQTHSKIPASQTENLFHTLETSKTPYGFEEPKQTPLDKTARLASTLFHETLVPLAVFGVMAGVSVLGIQTVRQYLEDNATLRLLKEAVKPFPTPMNLDEIKTLYSEPVQQTVDAFKRGKHPVLLLKGPQGSGKSYLQDALCQEYHNKPNALIIDAQVDPEICNILTDIYLNSKKSKRALSLLEKVHGKPFDTIIVRADNIQDYIPHLERLITHGIGNTESMQSLRSDAREKSWPWNRQPASKHLPTLKILASASQEVAFNWDAAQRIGSGSIEFVDYMSPESLAKIATKRFSPDNSEDQTRQGMENAFAELFREYPGYSTRRLEDIRRVYTPGGKNDPVMFVRQELEATPLDGAEAAALLRNLLMDRLASEYRKAGKNLSEEGINRFRKQAWIPAQNYAFKLGESLKSNGKVYKDAFPEIFDAVVKQSKLDFSKDPTQKTIDTLLQLLSGEFANRAGTL